MIFIKNLYKKKFYTKKKNISNQKKYLFKNKISIEKKTSNQK